MCVYIVSTDEQDDIADNGSLPYPECCCKFSQLNIHCLVELVRMVVYFSLEAKNRFYTLLKVREAPACFRGFNGRNEEDCVLRRSSDVNKSSFVWR